MSDIPFNGVFPDLIFVFIFKKDTNCCKMNLNNFSDIQNHFLQVSLGNLSSEIDRILSEYFIHL